MSKEGESNRPYSYSFRSRAKEPNEAASRMGYDTLLSIKQSLLLLTADCEVSYRPEGRFCEKHGLPVAEGKDRCDYLAERISKGGEESSKAQIQHYVNDILGIRDPKTVKRLAGSG